jgi:hypothetical protein
MTTRALLLGCLLLASAAQACGGAIDTTGTSSSSSGGSSGAPTPLPIVSPPSNPAPPSTGTSGTSPFNGTANGCANFTVFAGDASGRRFLIIQADKMELGLAGLGDTATVDLATKAGGASTKVFVDTYNRVPTQMYCTDTLSEPYDPVSADAIQGTATFTISAVGREGGTYAITVTLRGVVINNKGKLESIPDVTYSSVGVGWLPG